MNKTLAITAIVLVAVVMGMSTIAPAMAWVAETDRQGTACDKVTKLKEEGKGMPGFVIVKVCRGS